MMLTPAERRRVREFDSRVSAARAGEHTARHSAGFRPAGLHRARPSRLLNASRPARPLDGSGPSRVAPPSPEDLSGLVLLAERLGNAGGAVQADDEFRDRLRRRLVAVASVRAVNPEPGFRPPPEATLAGARRRPITAVRRRVPRRVTVATGTLAGLVALSGVGFASGGAHPGDALYGVKRSRESAQLTLARSPVARGALYLEFARARLAEATTATVTADIAQLDRLLDDMDADTRLGMADLGIAAMTQHHPAPLQLVDEFALAQERQLRQLRTGQLPAAANTRIMDSLTLLDAVGARSRGLSASVRCTDPFTMDYLGPLPHACPATQTGDPGVSSVQPAPPTATWTPRPRPRSSGRTSGRQTATPSGSAAATSESSQPEKSQRSSDAVVDDGVNEPWSPAEPVEPQSGTVLPGASGLPTTSATKPLLGSTDDSVGATSDLVERSGE